MTPFAIFQTRDVLPRRRSTAVHGFFAGDEFAQHHTFPIVPSAVTAALPTGANRDASARLGSRPRQSRRTSTAFFASIWGGRSRRSTTSVRVRSCSAVNATFTPGNVSLFLGPPSLSFGRGSCSSSRAPLFIGRDAFSTSGASSPGDKASLSVRRATFSMINVSFLTGSPLFLIGRVPFSVGRASVRVGKAPLSAGGAPFALGKVSFPAHQATCLVDNVGPLVAKASLFTCSRRFVERRAQREEGVRGLSLDLVTSSVCVAQGFRRGVVRRVGFRHRFHAHGPRQIGDRREQARRRRNGGIETSPPGGALPCTQSTTSWFAHSRPMCRMVRVP